uniref:Uncharacterized protein n=1 Tax=Oryza meridionalis TaxID=40149 RepID=A0A0E0F6N4_9ORYZ
MASPSLSPPLPSSSLSLFSFCPTERASRCSAAATREKRSASPVQWARQAPQGRSAAVAPRNTASSSTTARFTRAKGEDENDVGRSHAHAFQPCRSQEVVVFDDGDGGDDGDALPPLPLTEPLRRATVDGKDRAVSARS